MTQRSIARVAALIFATSLAGVANAQKAASDTVAAHVAMATSAAGQDLKGVLALCDTARPGAKPAGPPPVSADPAQEPMQVFDNLYFVGLKSVSAWVVKTSAGLVLIDSLDNTDEARTVIEGGLRKLGLDPAQIKYVVITHGHGDHYGGAQYLVDKFHPRLIASEADWKVMADAHTGPALNFSPPPKRDLTMGDGDKLTLGDTTLTLYLTPGHTPGTLSLIFPVTDKGRRHMAGLWGGTAFNFPRTGANFEVYSRSTEHFADVTRKAGVDVMLSNHATYDGSVEKMAALKTRAPGAPNPFVVGPSVEARFLRVADECSTANRLSLGE